ncbi:MAG: TPM domain-containing protein [Acidobacteriota bacterium]
MLPLLGLFAWLSGAAVAQEIPPAPTRWVTDTASFLSAETKDRLDSQLESYELSSGHQVLVWIGPTFGDGAVEDFTIKTFTAWRVGRKGIDDGLVLFVFADDRKVRVEVGYGLEERVPDIIANRIIQDRILPKIRAGDRDGAITEGVAGLISAIEGEPGNGAVVPGGSPARQQPAAEPADQPLSMGQKILYALIAIGVLIFIITNPGLAFWLLLQILSGSSGGGGRGGGGGGGGWSGGGGRGGGGGATGSW